MVIPLAASRRAGRHRPRLARVYRCICNKPVFFRNSTCLACNTPLGYEPVLGKLVPLIAEPGTGLWRIPSSRSRRIYRCCANLDSYAACNWIFPAEQAESGTTLCVSCRLTRTIPDLSIAENGEYWRRIEFAKRRLISSLVAMGLPIASRVSEDPERGLAFDFLRSVDGTPVQTGHSSGIITLNVEEADDSVRERVRQQMHEPYRTLLGHFRHETGHYYWDLLVDNSNWLNSFRELFGDERRDYAAALQTYYAQGAPADWPLRYVTAYASAHPWEDWAETWAHYLHLVDTLDTALSFGLDIECVELPFDRFGPDSLARPDEPGAGRFLELLNDWARLTSVLNELSRSMGLQDFYPFVLSREAVAKLHFVHTVVEAERQEKTSARTPRGRSQ